VLSAGTIGVLLLAGAAACASSTTTATSSDSSSVPVSAGSSSAASAPASGSASASPSGTASTSGSGSGTGASPSASASSSTGSITGGNPAVPGPGGIVVTPQAQLSTTPSGGKLTAFLSAAHSADGRTLYLGIESQGGACGEYNVVLQQSGDSVSVGLVHLSSSGRVCPMYVAHMLVEAKLSAPLDGRRVIDLANGQTVAAPQLA
jgi:hypothetical protein